MSAADEHIGENVCFQSIVGRRQARRPPPPPPKWMMMMEKRSKPSRLIRRLASSSSSSSTPELSRNSHQLSSSASSLVAPSATATTTTVSTIIMSSPCPFRISSLPFSSALCDLPSTSDITRQYSPSKHIPRRSRHPSQSKPWLLWLALLATTITWATAAVLHSPYELSHHHEPIDPYEKPSEFFNRYFTCRYQLQLSIEKMMLEFEHNLSSESSSDVVGDDDQNNRQEHARRHSRAGGGGGGNGGGGRRQPKMLPMCATDCDGVTMWMETKPGSIQTIECLEVLAAIKRPTFKIDLEESSGDGDKSAQANSAMTGRDATGMSNDDPTTLLRHIPNENKITTGLALRKCRVDGHWEGPGNYSACGLNATRLFVLKQQQLERIYEIREMVVSSKFEKNAKTEEAFVRCVDTVLSQPHSKLPEPYCERTFDGWSCFNDTPAGSVTRFKCPEVYGFNPQNEAVKTCTEEGKWKTHPVNQKPWTNYTSCVDIPDLQFRNIIIRLNIIGYSISLVALLISLGIFWCFKALSTQTRIRIHKNLFVSFIVNNSMWIAWFNAITDQNILEDNGYYCQALHVLLQYFLVCNYFWMFCEGLYLHTLLVVAFVSEGKILKWFYLVGWGLPAIFVTAYAAMRANSHQAQNCWIEESKYTWIYNVPVCISFLLNIIFLINIVRVLVTKLQAVNTADTHQTRKAVRATLILLPLLGLHFILTPFRPETNSSASQAYEMFSALVSSLQGCCVAMLFCFFNGEVLTQIKKRWNQFLLVHGYGTDRRMSYGNTVSIRLSNCNLNMHNNNNNNNKNGHLKSRKDTDKVSKDPHEVLPNNSTPAETAGDERGGLVPPPPPLHYEHLTRTASKNSNNNDDDNNNNNLDQNGNNT